MDELQLINGNYKLVNVNIYKPARNSFFNLNDFYTFKQTIYSNFKEPFQAGELVLFLCKIFNDTSFEFKLKMISSYYDKKTNLYTLNFKLNVSHKTELPKPKCLLIYQKVFKRVEL